MRNKKTLIVKHGNEEEYSILCRGSGQEYLRCFFFSYRLIKSVSGKVFIPLGGIKKRKKKKNPVRPYLKQKKNN